MSLESGLLIATGGLSNISQQFAVISQNVANASTPDYALEVANQSSLTADGQGMGVRTLPATRDVNTQVQQSLDQQNALVTNLQTAQSALQSVDAVQGTVGAADDLPSLLGKLQDALSTLQNNPSDQTQQVAVASAAGTVTNKLNSLSRAYVSARQAAQSDINTGVTTLNTTLATIGSLTDQIISLKAQGLSTADLENQRDAALDTVNTLVGIKTLDQANGDVLVLTTSGLQLPIHGPANPVTTADATIGPASTVAGGTIPPITIAGIDVTGQITGGQLGADVTLRDTTMPTFQAELDEFSQTLATQFSAQGLSLFTDPAGNIPTGGGSPVQGGTATQSYIGFSGVIGVNPAVTANPGLVRDGNVTVAGSATGATAFTPNPAGGPAGFTTLISRLLNYALGADVQDGVAQPAPNVTGLGPSGTLSTPYAAPTTLASAATDLVGAQSQVSALTTDQVTSEQALQTTLQAKLQSTDGVSIDTEMSLMVQLQNAYGANARILSAAQAMWTQLLQTIP